jgi:hypothetical protein
MTSCRRVEAVLLYFMPAFFAEAGLLRRTFLPLEFLLARDWLQFVLFALDFAGGGSPNRQPKDQ